MVQLQCRRCLEESVFERDVLLQEAPVPTCPKCGKGVVWESRSSGTITGADYTLPADRMAMRSLRRVPGLIKLVQLYSRLVQDDDWLLDRYADDVEVSDRQFSDIFRVYADAGARLSYQTASLPPLFLTQDPHPNAFAFGVESCHIVVTTGLLDLMDDGELAAVLGHELGHVQSGHVTYTTALAGLLTLAGEITARSGTRIDDKILHYAAGPTFLAYVRASERTADRAGMLAAPRPRDMMTALVKLAGAPPSRVDTVNLDAFIDQALQYDKMIEDSPRRRLLAAKDVLRKRDHPFPSVRIRELLELVESGNWLDILEQVNDASAGRWEVDCAHCGGHVAEWDVVCRHCGWTIGKLPSGDDSMEVDDPNPDDRSEGDPPPDPDDERWIASLGQRGADAAEWLRGAWRKRTDNG